MFHKSVMGRGVSTHVKDVTLADYIARKQEKTSMSFDQYKEINYEDYDPWDWDMIELGWTLALRNT